MIHAICFCLERSVPLNEAEQTLHLAMFAMEGLVGRVRVRMESQYLREEALHAIAVNVSSRTGLLVARVFAGLLSREFGEDAFFYKFIHVTPEQRELQMIVT